MFASYKGEGTGAVRHMFSHHILKPERTPIEANPWGTCKSSGSFSTLYKSRLKRALDYREAPFEIAVERHHSRNSGWTAVAEAVLGAGFSMVQSQPVKSEMSGATPKSQAKHPIDLDVLIICRKRADDVRQRRTDPGALEAAVETVRSRVERFISAGREVSLNDVRVILLSQLLVELSAGRNGGEVGRSLDLLLPKTGRLTEDLWRNRRVEVPTIHGVPSVTQLSLFEATATA